MRVFAFLLALSAARAAVDSTMATTATFDSQDEAGGSESDAEITANLRTASAPTPTPPSSSSGVPQALPSIISISTLQEYMAKLFRSMFSYLPAASETSPSRTNEQNVQCATTTTTSRSADEDFSTASLASGGFFTDITRRHFNLIRDIACYENLNKVQEFVDKGVDSIHTMDLYMDSYFWQQNYEPVFSCQFQRRMGYRGDGGKWVCDPHRIERDNCLVYSIGARLEHSFESAVAGGLGTSFIVTFFALHHSFFQ